MNKENCALKLVDEKILYYEARSKKTSNQISTFTKILPVGGEIFHADRQTDRHEEATNNF